ncbi:MAG: glutathione peroxidase [Planctomycetaceae bacterium]
MNPHSFVHVAIAAICATVIVCLSTPASSADAVQATGPLVGTMKKLDGKEVDLSGYRGKVVLIVNVASQCGYTPQYAGLQRLFDQHKDRGLVVLGVPANEVGGQEPGSDKEIATFCSARYGVTFDMLSKVVVKGPDMCPLYKSLTTTSTPAGDVKWNFEKVLIGRDGRIVGRFASKVAPDDPQLVAAIEKELVKK